MTERITGVIDRLSDAEDYNSISWILEAPVENIALSAVDDTMKTNADFQHEAGLESSVTRYTEPDGKWPCDWCQGLEGTYSIDDYPSELFMHHERCRCVIEWDNKQTGTYDVLRAVDTEPYWQKIDPAEIEGRKNFVGVNTKPQKIATNDMAIKYGKENYAKIEQTVARADDEMQAVWNKYVDDIGVRSTTYKGGAHFKPWEEGIYLDVNADVAGSNWEKPLQVTFHESGHNIDYLAGGRNRFVYYSTQYNNGAFKQALLEDYEAFVADKEAVLKKAFKEGDRQTLIDNGLRLSANETKYYKNYTYRAIEHELSKDGYMATSSVSDITEGASKAKIRAGVGHGKKYWSYNGSLEKEAFAEFTEAEMANPEELEVMKKYYPRAYKVYREMIAELAK